MISVEHSLLHTGLTSVQGPLVFVRNVQGVGLYDRVEVIAPDDSVRAGRVVSIAAQNAGATGCRSGHAGPRV
jgi:vacuolar-type H+-ATPase subunit B/Vma2